MKSTVILSLIVLAWLVCATDLANAANERLAVLEFQGKRLDQEALLTFSDAVRGGALEGVAGRGIDVITRENMMAVLKSMGKRECAEGECEVETAQNIGADYVISGTVVKIEERYVVTLKLHDTKGAGSLLGSVQVEAKSQLEVLRNLKETGGDLVRLHLLRKHGANRSVGKELKIGSDADDFSVQDDRVLVKFESVPPGAAVLIDGDILCKETPCSKSIQAGKHTLELHRERYLRFQQTLTAQKGSLVKVTLEPNFAVLELKTIPEGLPLLLDGKSIVLIKGKAEVDPGQHEIVIDSACYMRSGERIVVKRGDARSVVIEGKQRMSAVSVSAEGAKGDEVEANVTVDGNPVGITPGTFKVSACSREVVVTGEGTVSRTPLTLVEKEVFAIKVRLGVPDEKGITKSIQLPPLPPSSFVKNSPTPLSKDLGIATGAIGLAGIGSGIYFYFVARGASRNVTNSTTFNPSDEATGKNAETMQMVGYSVGAAALIASAFLFFYPSEEAKKPEHISLVPTLTRTGLAFTATGAF